MSPIYKVLVSYGGGSHLLTPIAESKAWNTIAWALIVVATIGWTIDLAWYYL